MDAFLALWWPSRVPKETAHKERLFSSSQNKPQGDKRGRSRCQETERYFGKLPR